MNNTFRRRCESALIHPATVASVALLLLNDIVFKALWPDAWATGKLSDLAWMVFAPPLLAFLLSFLTGRNTTAQPVVFLTAYAGLPLLYAAFNTFAPVHDIILRGLSFASGGIAGSPLDATDSIVIPFAMVAAFWVWRRPVVSTERLRLHWGLLAAGVAALASVATSYPDPDYGIRDLAVRPDGTVYAWTAPTYTYHYYLSSNGGVTWTKVDASERQHTQGSQSARTPVGTYAIDGPDILLSRTDGKRELAYSAAYLGNEANVWVQQHATTHLDIRKIAREPYSIVYDEPSGNVIVAMGIQGVLLGTPDGRWTPSAVGPYTPTDFSFSGKTGQLLSNAGFLAGMLALALVMAGSALLLAQYRMRDVPMLVGVLIVTLALLVGVPALLVFTGNEDYLNLLLWLPPATFLVTVVGGGTALAVLPQESRTRKSLGMLMVIPALMASAGLVLVFGGSDASAFSNYGLVQVMFGVPAFVLGFALVGGSWKQLKHWRFVVPAFLGMNVLVVLPFMLWLHLGIALELAKISAIVLTALVAVVLAGYLKRLQQPQ
ncbi:MAG: hypothetical protein OXE50_06360 [Chloroflexi bacterium]|nr:hypothetical protein [Chloroflexota bacterium]